MKSMKIFKYDDGTILAFEFLKFFHSFHGKKARLVIQVFTFLVSVWGVFCVYPAASEFYVSVYFLVLNHAHSSHFCKWIILVACLCFDPCYGHRWWWLALKKLHARHPHLPPTSFAYMLQICCYLTKKIINTVKYSTGRGFSTMAKSSEQRTLHFLCNKLYLFLFY